MSVLLFLVLIAAIAWLWRRVDGLEREIARLQRDALPIAPPRPDSAVPAVEPTAASAVSAPEGAVEPAPEAEPPPAFERVEDRFAWRPRFDFEDLFGRLLPIWAGGITLAVAGFFLVRWSIDAGLLTPAVRVALAGLFGLALIAGAEIAYRWRERVADPRVAQALAGAGLATLYAAFYLAGTAYGLIGSTLAFLGLAGVTAAAIGLSYRFGLPSAVLGLVGGFAAPALVGSEEANLPLLTLYLALVTAGLAVTGRRQDRAWLGVAALAGGLGWGALLLAGGVREGADGVVLGAYLVLLGAIVPGLTGVTAARPHWLVRVGAAGVAALQLAFLVQQGGFGALEWSLYLLLGAALAWFGWRQPAMREANGVAAATGVALLFAWSDPAPAAFALVSAGLAGIFAGVPLGHLARGHGRALDIAQVAGVAVGIALAALWHFGEPLPETPRLMMALSLAALACLPVVAVFLAERSRVAHADAAVMVAQAIAALCGFGALAQVLPHDALPWTAAALAALLAWRAGTRTAAIATLVALAALWAAVPLFVWLQAGVLALVGNPMEAGELPTVRAVALFLLPTVVGATAWSFVAPPTGRSRMFVAAMGLAVAGIAAHVVFRHAFAALASGDFVASGVIERAAWEALLLGAAYAAMARGWRRAAVALAVAALAHFAWFALVLHNPLWSRQAVGALPIVNALLPAYAVGVAVLVTLRRWLGGRGSLLRWLIDSWIMLAVSLFALSALRQLFAGSLLFGPPLGATEDLLRSLLGIVLAIGFLAWGARTRERSWRIGSLVLMVVAVLKVFLIDAAGLEGLARIASFMVLGFSLIGIGWFYARQLRALPMTAEGAP